MRCCVVHVLLARLPPARVLQERDRYLNSKSGIVELTWTSEVGRSKGLKRAIWCEWNE
jgi:hypothetical protein